MPSLRHRAAHFALKKLDTRKNHGFGGHDWPDCRDRRESYA
jgi:hypothetical protein